MKLRTIPPANRMQSRSLRVGAISRPAERVKLIEANKRVAEMRREYRAAIDTLAEKFATLCQAAESAGEMTEVQFWRAAIGRLRKES